MEKFRLSFCLAGSHWAPKSFPSPVNGFRAGLNQILIEAGSADNEVELF